MIHPTAIINPAADIDSTVEIGPYVVIEGPVKIGPRCRLMAHSYVCGNTVMGADNIVYNAAVLGQWPQHLGYSGAESSVEIGNGNIFREYVTVHRAYHPGHKTTIGNNNFFMANSHVAHDTRVDNNVIMGNGSLLAGHTWVMDKVNISGNVAVHQYVRIGPYAMVGGLSKIVKDIPPYMMVDGASEICGLNTVGLRRAGFDLPTRDKIKQAYKVLYRSGLNVPNAVKQLREQFGDSQEVQSMVAFIENSVRGISRHCRSSD